MEKTVLSIVNSCDLTLGERITLLRKRAKMSTRVFAERANMSQSDLWRLETGVTKNPHWLRVVLFANILDVSLDDLAGRYEPYVAEAVA